jgi:probable HAF family extracellular repeat protein
MRSLSTLVRLGLVVACAAMVNGGRVDAAPPTAATAVTRLDVPRPVVIPAQDGYEVLELPPLGDGDSVGVAVGASGKVVGYVRQANGVTAATLWNNGQSMSAAQCSASIAQDLGPNDLPIGTCGANAAFIGTSIIAGTLVFGAGPQGKYVGARVVDGAFHAWVTSNLPSPSAMVHPPGFVNSVVLDMDNNRLSVGYAAATVNGLGPARAVFWPPSGIPVLLPGHPPTHDARAVSINDGGLMVGRVGVGGAPNERAVKWQPNSLAMVELGSLGGRSGASAVNAIGSIVGWSYDADGDLHGVIFKNDKPVDLNTLIHRPLVQAPNGQWELGSEWVLQEASGINDAGYICGAGTKGGKVRGFLLKPRSSGVATISAVDVKKLIAATHPTRALSEARENPLRLK